MGLGTRQMTVLCTKGFYSARSADDAGDLAAAQNLRARAFPSRNGALDQDEFDEFCNHILIEDVGTGKLVCCFRFFHVKTTDDLSKSYSSQYYHLASLNAFPGQMLELGRFCIDPDCSDPAILRVAWSVITRFVDDNAIALLFGCSSFAGLEFNKHKDAFVLLKDKHLAPAHWLPGPKAPEIIEYAEDLRYVKPRLKLAQKAMPPLLRTYLAMGGWVSDHAVVDRHMNTLHVFTGVEIAAIPENRKRLLRADAA